MARTSRRVARRDVSEVRDEPGLQWGWHGTFPNAQRVAGVVVAILLILLLIGPYQSHLQDWWLVGIAIGLVALIVRGTIKRRNAWRK